MLQQLANQRLYYGPNLATQTGTQAQADAGCAVLRLQASALHQQVQHAESATAGCAPTGALAHLALVLSLLLLQLLGCPVQALLRLHSQHGVVNMQTQPGRLRQGLQPAQP